MAEISVIVPIYNIEKYVRKCIESICTQSFVELEIILVDDGSTDSSGKICDEFREKDSRIKVIHKENGGLVSARKAGLMAATSAFVTYVDGDDWIEKDAYDCMYHDICNYNVDAVFYGHFETVGQKDRVVLHNVPKGYHDKESLIKNVYPQMIAGEEFFSWGLFPSVWDAMYRREVLLQSQMDVPNEIRMGEDAACIYPMLLQINSIFVSDECFYHYRQTGDSMIKTTKSKSIEQREFYLLYKNGNEKFSRLSHVYDVRSQWLYYMLFMMIPRADHLYNGYEELPYLFPYSNAKKGMAVAIYGAGMFGRRLYSYLKKSGVCDVVAWFDRNYSELQEEGLCVISPEELPNYKFDIILIANMFANARKQIYEAILKKCPKATIGVIEDTFITEKETLKAFGLLQEGEDISI